MCGCMCKYVFVSFDFISGSYLIFFKKFDLGIAFFYKFSLMQQELR